MVNMTSPDDPGQAAHHKRLLDAMNQMVQSVNKSQNDLQSKNDNLKSENSQLQSKVGTLEREVDSLKRQIAELRQSHDRPPPPPNNSHGGGYPRDRDGESTYGAGGEKAEQGGEKAEEGAFKFQRAIITHQDPIHDVAVHPDSTIVASASWDSTMTLYDMKTEKKTKLGESTDEQGKMGGLYAVSFAKTAKNLLGCTSADQSVYLWDWEKGTKVRALSGHKDEVNGIDFHYNKNVMCSVGDDEKAIIWDFQEGIQLRQLDHEKAVYGSKFLGHSMEFCVATCCFDTHTRIFDMRDKQVVQKLSGHQDDVIGIDHSEKKGYIATGSDDGTILVWDSRNYSTPLHKLNTKETKAGDASEVKRIKFSPCGEYVAAGTSSNLVLVYKTTGGRPQILELHKQCVFGVDWGVRQDRKEMFLVSASHDNSCGYWTMPQ